MQKQSLTNLAVIIILTIAFFALLTQRMMLSTDLHVSNISDLMRGKESNNSVHSTFFGNIASPKSKTVANNIKPNAQSTSKAAQKSASPIVSPVIEKNNQLPAKLDLIPKGGGTNIHFNHVGNKPSAAPPKPEQPKTLETKKEVELHDLSIATNHPWISPRKGTDISPEHHLSITICPNQSKCVIPEIQLEPKLKVYFCKHPIRSGVRFYFLAREGLLLHPNIEMITDEDIHNADFIVYLPGSAPWHLTECSNASFANKLIVLDEFDGHGLFAPTLSQIQYKQAYGGNAKPWYFMYFKRSFVRRMDGKFKRYPHLNSFNVYPMTYAVAEAYIPYHFNSKREIEILCTLRGSKHMTTRLRAQTWVAEYGKERKLPNVISGQINTASRTVVSKQYFEQMYNSKIIVTVNPAHWEGDFRLWEAMCTGALIFVDPVFVPHPFPLEHGKHVIFFNNNNRTDLFEKLDYYVKHHEEARKIAIQGYLHAMKYHRTVNLIDYVMRSAHLRQAIENNVKPLPKYSYTGQYLLQETKIQHSMIIKCDSPGIFDPFYHNYSSTVPRLSCGETAKVEVKPVTSLRGSNEEGKVEKSQVGGNIRFG